MSKTKEYYMDEQEKNWEFMEKEHEGGQHQQFVEDCPTCFSENRILKAHRTVNRNSEFTNEALTRNSFGSNYPLGFQPE